MAIPIGIAGPAYKAQSIISDDQLTTNFYPEVVDDPLGRGISQLTLYPTPGLTLWVDETATARSGRSRGLLDLGSTLLWVSGENVYTINTAGTPTLRGHITDDGNPVWMEANLASQVFIVSGGLGYIYNTSTAALVQITDPDFPTTVSAAFADQYFFALRNTAQELNISASGNGLSWNALDFTTIEAANDPQVAIKSLRREIWAFGQRLTNIYYDSGNIDFPYDLRPGGTAEFGLAARYSVAEGNQSLKWLGRDDDGFGVVLMAKSYQPEVISDKGIENAIQSYSKIDDAIGFTQQDRGHEFYWLYFPTADKTWVHDETTGMWHERAYWNGLTGMFEAHRANTHAVFNKAHVVGDRADGRLWIMGATAYKDGLDLIRRVRRCPHLIKGASAGQGRHIHKALRLFMETGVGLQVGSGVQGEDPKMIMRYSDDGGKTWSNDLEADMGKSGKYNTIVEWRRLGSANISRTYEITVTEPVPTRIMAAYLDVE
jgi:hypothetical protein